MSWKDLKRFWTKPAETNILIGDAYIESNQRFGSPGLSQTEATAIAYGVIDSAATRDNSEDVIHLIVGSYNLWPAYFIATVLGKAGYINHKVGVVVPKFFYSALKKDILNIPALDNLIIPYRSQSKTDMKKLAKYKMASVFVYSYEYMFNWEYYGLDLNHGGYIIFMGVRLPIAKFYTLPGWKLKGKYSSLYFVSKDKSRSMGLIPTKEEKERLANSSNDSDKGKEPESTEEDIQDPK